MAKEHKQDSMTCEHCGADMEPMNDIFKACWKCPECEHIQEEDLDYMEGAMNIRQTIIEEVQPLLLDIRAKVDDWKKKLKGNHDKP